jgi:hypothetical protein
VLYKKRKDDIRLSCGLNSVNTIRGDGYIIANNILDERCRNNLVNTFLDEMRQNKNLNEDRNLQFYSNEQFLNELSALVGEKLYPVNSLDLQRCWLRYYFEGMKAQYYENYHHDTKRYRSDITHYRLIIPIYDTSNSVFSIENYGSFPFKENMGVFVETGNCLHKVKFTTGERLLLFMDFTNKPCDSLGNHYTCRGINGYMYWIKDSIWRKFSETYYKLVN